MKFIFFLTTLFAAAMAASNPLGISRIEILDSSNFQVGGLPMLDNLTRVPQEVAIYAVKSTKAGYARTTNVGLTVQKGTSGEIWFKIRAWAVTTEILAKLTVEFEKSLTLTEKDSLNVLKSTYDGSYDIPWLHTLGINLDKGTTKFDIEKEHEKSATYNARAEVAKQLLKEVTEQHLEVHGHLTAHGVSFIPTTVFSFIKFARIYFEDGTDLTVISKHPGDLAAATKDGSTTVPVDNGGLEILAL